MDNENGLPGKALAEQAKTRNIGKAHMATVFRVRDKNLPDRQIIFYDYFIDTKI